MRGYVIAGCILTSGLMVSGQAPLTEFRIRPTVRVAVSGQTPSVKVSAESATVTIDGQTGVVRLTWPGASSPSLVEVVTLDLEGNLPADHEYMPVQIHISRLGRVRAADVVLATFPRDASAATARLLFGRAVTSMSLAALTEFYPKARASALARMDVLREDWRRLDDYTVQAVYKYLQAALWMAKGEPRTVFEDDGLDRARLFLTEALAAKPERVRAALGSPAMAPQLLHELRIAGGAQLGRIWAAVTKLPTPEDKCANLEMFRSAAEETRIDGLHKGLVLSALAQCQVEIFKREPSASRISILGDLESSMVSVIGLKTTPEAVRTLLRSDIGTIRALGIR